MKGTIDNVSFISPAAVEAFVEGQLAMAMEAKSGGGGGSSTSISEDWKAKVDEQLGQLHGDVRNMLYGLIGGFIFVISMVGGLWMHVDDKFDKVNAKFDSKIDVVSAKFDGKFETLGQQLSDLRAEQAKTSAKLDLLIERTAPAERAKR